MIPPEQRCPLCGGQRRPGHLACSDCADLVTEAQLAAVDDPSPWNEPRAGDRCARCGADVPRALRALLPPLCARCTAQDEADAARAAQLAAADAEAQLAAVDDPTPWSEPQGGAARAYADAVAGMATAALSFVSFCAKQHQPPAHESASEMQKLLGAALTYARAHVAYHGSSSP